MLSPFGRTCHHCRPAKTRLRRHPWRPVSASCRLLLRSIRAVRPVSMRCQCLPSLIRPLRPDRQRQIFSRNQGAPWCRIFPVSCLEITNQQLLLILAVRRQRHQPFQISRTGSLRTCRFPSHFKTVVHRRHCPTPRPDQQRWTPSVQRIRKSILFDRLHGRIRWAMGSFVKR